MGEAAIDFLELELANGVTDDEKRELPFGGVLVYATVGFETGTINDSINVSLVLLLEATPPVHLKLIGGWIWYPTVASHADDLVWAGRIKIPRNTFLRLGGTNLTGAVSTIRVEYLMEDP